ncbi:DUF2514 domain-containing protein [Escherichia coli]|uniref:DUF2514 family protein n=1 Tax=Escherichia coli TaxID=562 RepID=UPI0015DF6CF6|nr:DUF2514 family protein [Escherichia coli]EFE7939912.1 DUF2514 domain-containing protein [Escherichia coli]EFG4205768.1 DUF2514 domain-containing protein [Escherichia coli]ELH3079341.1 DUF2514 domain-containing protein [Escherichia coli]MDA6764019.1 DUF2514 family protein [Escherichia coli]NZC84016.1 DUF2514 domain-containing protein [Escherichia coli]
MTLLLGKYWKPLALIVLVALSLWAFGHWRYVAGVTATDNAWQEKWTARDAADVQAVADLQAKNRQTEQERQNGIAKAAAQASQQLTRAQADAAHARTDADSLRQQVADYARQLQQSRASGNTGTATGSRATTPGAGVLAELYARADERAQRLAEIADESRIRGDACQRAYAALQNH